MERERNTWIYFNSAKDHDTCLTDIYRCGWQHELRRSTATTKAPKHGETENYSGRRRSVTSWHVVPPRRWPGVKGSLGPLRLAAAFLRQPVRSRFPRGMEVDVSPASFVLDSGEVRESSTPKPSVLLRCLLEGRAAHSSSTGPP